MSFKYGIGQEAEVMCRRKGRCTVKIMRLLRLRTGDAYYVEFQDGTQNAFYINQIRDLRTS